MNLSRAIPGSRIQGMSVNQEIKFPSWQMLGSGSSISRFSSVLNLVLRCHSTKAKSKALEVEILVSFQLRINLNKSRSRKKMRESESFATRLMYPTVSGSYVREEKGWMKKKEKARLHISKKKGKAPFIFAHAQRKVWHTSHQEFVMKVKTREKHEDMKLWMGRGGKRNWVLLIYDNNYMVIVAGCWRGSVKPLSLRNEPWDHLLHEIQIRNSLFTSLRFP